MKNLILNLTVSTLISAFAISCNKCGLCNNPAVNIDIDAAKVCKSGNSAEYKAAITECEDRGDGWYWDEIKK